MINIGFLLGQIIGMTIIIMAGSKLAWTEFIRMQHEGKMTVEALIHIKAWLISLCLFVFLTDVIAIAYVTSGRFLQ